MRQVGRPVRGLRRLDGVTELLISVFLGLIDTSQLECSEDQFIASVHGFDPAPSAADTGR